MFTFFYSVWWRAVIAVSRSFAVEMAFLDVCCCKGEDVECDEVFLHYHQPSSADVLSYRAKVTP